MFGGRNRIRLTATMALLCPLWSIAAQGDRSSEEADAILRESGVKGGLIVGGQYGEGALRRGGKTQGYYSSAAASYGLQAGVQSFGYAMFFMTDDALAYLKKSKGWEVGVGPSFVVVDDGMASSLTTTTDGRDGHPGIEDREDRA